MRWALLRGAPPCGNSCSPLALEDVFGILQVWGLLHTGSSQLTATFAATSGRRQKSSVIRTEWGSVGAIVVFSQSIPWFSSLPCACFPRFHEGWVRLIWNRAQVKVPGTLSTSQKGTIKAWRVLWFGPGKNLSGIGGILRDYPAKYLVTEEKLLFSFIAPFIIFAAEPCI